MIAVNWVRFNCLLLLVAAVVVSGEVWDSGSICPQGEIYYRDKCVTVHQILHDIFNSPSTNVDNSSESSHADTLNLEATDEPFSLDDMCEFGEDFIDGKCVSNDFSSELIDDDDEEDDTSSSSTASPSSTVSSTSTVKSTRSTSTIRSTSVVTSTSKICPSSSTSSTKTAISTSTEDSEEDWESEEEVITITKSPINRAIAAVLRPPPNQPERAEKICPDHMAYSEGECRPVWL